ncbi:hypothetical protein [Comamonas fluminis]|uniref:hypothetical protein n=1 Tax=Comamonas fluminis TaxID=2796366 RepID=UPI001C46DB64|nr:hypothetical protein [Comamonas fluminis]
MATGKTVSMGAILGLNNRLPPTRMEVTQPNRSKASWLQVANNIDLTEGGLLKSRQGFQAVQAGYFHSLWADEADAYAVRDGHLVKLDARTMAAAVVVPDVGNARVSYARLPDGMVYWSNGLRIGRMAGAVSRALVTNKPNPAPVAVPVVGSLPAGRYQVCFTALGADGESPSTEPVALNLPDGGGIAFQGMTPDTLAYATGPNGEIFNEVASGDYLSLGNTGAVCNTFMLAAMPPGHQIAHYRGSLLAARGTLLYLSEPYRYGLLNLGRAFIPFPSEITVVQPCEDGLYVCADKTYWIPGDPLASAPTVVLPYGALCGSAAFDPHEQTAYWQGPQGLVVAKPGGQVAVPQDEALIFGAARSGATLVREQGGDRHVVTARFDVEPI